MDLPVGKFPKGGLQASPDGNWMRQTHSGEFLKSISSSRVANDVDDL